MCLESEDGLQGEKWIISRHGGENSCTDNKYHYHLWKDWLFIGRLRYSEMFISTYIPTYKGNSLWNSLHNHRYHFGFPFEVRFRHCICIDISESGNANSQIGKSKALMRWFSVLLLHVVKPNLAIVPKPKHISSKSLCSFLSMRMECVPDIAKNISRENMVLSAKWYSYANQMFIGLKGRMWYL